MRHFESNGVWFPFDEPSNKVPGIFRFSKDGLSLHLIGSFEVGWIPQIKNYKAICGVVGTTPYGSFVTLYDCLQKSRSISTKGIGSETIECPRAYIGDSYVDEDLEQIQSVNLKTTYLYDWVQPQETAVRIDLDPKGKEVVARYVPDAPRPFETENGQVLVGLTWSTSSGHKKASIYLDASIVLTPSAALTAKGVVTRYPRTVQDLLTFATDRPNAVEEVSLTSIKKSQDSISYVYYYIFDRILSLDGKAEPLASNALLFTLEDSQQAGLNMFQRWFEFRTKHHGFCNTYFGSLYGQPRYLEEKFLRAISAFTLLCGSLYEPSPAASQFLHDVTSSLATKFTEQERALLTHVVPTAQQVEMPLHMLRLLNENNVLMRQVINDFSAFVSAISATIRSIETRTEGVDASRLAGADLLHATQKIRLLIKLVVLKELGFHESHIVRLVKKNKGFADLRTISGR